MFQGRGCHSRWFPNSKCHSLPLAVCAECALITLFGKMRMYCHLPREALARACAYRTARDPDRYCPSYKSLQSSSPVLLSRVHLEKGTDSIEHIVAAMQWGLVPSWFKGADPSKLQFNTPSCCSDTIMEKRSFKVPLGKGRRCVVLADGFCEWQPCQARSQRQPYFIYFPQIKTKVRELGSCKGLNVIHPRRPAILDGEEAVSKWLDFGEVLAQEALKFSHPTENTAFHPVSPLVNDSRNSTPECLLPVHLLVKKEQRPEDPKTLQRKTPKHSKRSSGIPVGILDSWNKLRHEPGRLKRRRHRVLFRPINPITQLRPGFDYIRVSRVVGDRPEEGYISAKRPQTTFEAKKKMSPTVNPDAVSGLSTLRFHLLQELHEINNFLKDLEQLWREGFPSYQNSFATDGPSQQDEAPQQDEDETYTMKQVSACSSECKTEQWLAEGSFKLLRHTADIGENQRTRFKEPRGKHWLRNSQFTVEETEAEDERGTAGKKQVVKKMKIQGIGENRGLEEEETMTVILLHPSLGTKECKSKRIESDAMALEKKSLSDMTGRQFYVKAIQQQKISLESGRGNSVVLSNATSNLRHLKVSQDTKVEKLPQGEDAEDAGAPAISEGILRPRAKPPTRGGAPAVAAARTLIIDLSPDAFSQGVGFQTWKIEAEQEPQISLRTIFDAVDEAASIHGERDPIQAAVAHHAGTKAILEQKRLLERLRSSVAHGRKMCPTSVNVNSMGTGHLCASVKVRMLQDAVASTLCKNLLLHQKVRKFETECSVIFIFHYPHS
uniref:Abasic site processing protein HMCES n=1 Tax=Monodon monoceros TaxID=40151 RepID=A0A8C6AKV5_MONMO